ncbi:MAG TPA: glycoside hydrolase family 130 protein [Puia sp.]|nr:glycoside hydrolase family 130 protein [Puia sp.]
MKIFIHSALLIFSALTCTAQNQLDRSLISFYKPAENPVLRPDSNFTFLDPIKKQTVRWQKSDVFNPAAIVKDGKVYLLFRAEDNKTGPIGSKTSRIGVAASDDGIHFKKFPKPVLYPDTGPFMKDDYPGGCEDPRIVETASGDYVIIYTAWNGKKALLSSAVSKDLFHWQKKGAAFAKANNGRFLKIWTKSASIITKMVNGKLIAAKINGKYWMYWGEHFVNLASSDNLVDWYPELDQKGELKRAMETRPGKFDSDLTECGPPAVITKAGIVLLYNGRNSENSNVSDPAMPKGMYSVGQVVFDVNNPGKVVARSDTSFIRPTLPHEITGQYHAGDTFSEGLVFFKNKWFLYYGTADSFVGLAISA